ncbi:MFS family permease [Methanomicrobium sp. W14]|uniref:MFS transporter n=1 Tax=Methanomicrobium sp. W14 TaxID=2817839 RepID=UPI001AE63AEF|nr:MFS transporter [Methanomicrobium sp. W14]MBP2134223.1 MFS family permease [Methanomicrobium sp. W14]
MANSKLLSPDSPLVIITIMSIFFLLMGFGTITPALDVIMKAFPDLSISTFYLISTLPSLILVPGSMIAGAIAGTKVKYKVLALIGIALFTLGGIAPVFLDDFSVILLNRAIFGFGIGMLYPLGSALILGLYEGEMQARLLGMGTIVMNIGGIVLQFFGGYFASFGWHASFWAHAFAIISFILVLLFLPEPNKSVQEENGDKPKEKVRVPSSVWALSLIWGFTVLMLYPVLLNMSTFMDINSLGGSAVAGIVLSFFTVGGMIAGVIFSKMTKLKATRRYLLTIAMFAVSLGLGLVLYGGNIVLVTIGISFVGIGFSTMYPGVLMLIGLIVTPDALAKSTAIMTICMGIFEFISGYWIELIGDLTGDAIAMPLFVGMVIVAVCAVISIFINPYPKNDVANKSGESS